MRLKTRHVSTGIALTLGLTMPIGTQSQITPSFQIETTDSTSKTTRETFYCHEPDSHDVCKDIPAKYKFTTPLEAFDHEGERYEETRKSQQITYTTRSTRPIPGGIRGRTCAMHLNHGTIIHVDTDQTTVQSGVRTIDITANLVDMVNAGHGDVSTHLNGRGTISLNDLMGPNSAHIIVLNEDLEGAMGGMQQTHYGQWSIPPYTTIKLDPDEINNQARFISGNTSRELALTLLHELTHVYLNAEDSRNEIHFDRTFDDENDIDDFSAMLLDEIEIRALKKDFDPYRARTCHE